MTIDQVAAVLLEAAREQHQGQEMIDLLVRSPHVLAELEPLIAATSAAAAVRRNKPLTKPAMAALQLAGLRAGEMGTRPATPPMKT